MLGSTSPFTPRLVRPRRHLRPRCASPGGEGERQVGSCSRQPERRCTQQNDSCPRWSRNSRELFFWEGQTMMPATVDLPPLKTDAPGRQTGQPPGPRHHLPSAPKSHSAMSRLGLAAGAHAERHKTCRLSRNAFAITDTELNVIAALAMIGLNSRPNAGYNTPAATGTPSTL